MNRDQSCVIVGAGMAGLTAAEYLQSQGWDVVVLDKGRHVGGRMATRTMGASRLDHGAQFFTARDSRFQKAVERWQHEGWVTHWFTQSRFTESRFTETGRVRYRAEGGMNSLAGRLAKQLHVRTATKVESILPIENRWQVITETAETFRAGALLLTPPSPQSIALVKGWADQLPGAFADSLQSVSYDPCFALLVILEGASLDGRTRVPSPGYIHPENGPIEWIADNTQKGVSGSAIALTIHARADFSRDHLESPRKDVARALMEAAEPWLTGTVTAWQLHRWLYSRPVAASYPGYLCSLLPSRVAIAGDGLGGPNVEGAFLSGLRAAEWIAGVR